MNRLAHLFLFVFIILLSGCYSFHTTEYKNYIEKSRKKACAYKLSYYGSSIETPLCCAQESSYEYANGTTIEGIMKGLLQADGFRAATNAPITLSINLSPSMSTDWSHGVTDTLINVPGGLCLFSFWSVRQKCYANLQVTSFDKKILKKYDASESYNSKVIGFFFSGLCDENQQPDVIEWRLKHALMIDLLDQFIGDYNKGVFDKTISQWENRNVRTSTPKNNDKNPPVQESEYSGTGFSVNEHNIVTAYHLVKNAKKIEVSFDGEKWISASLVKSSESLDIAILKVSKELPHFLPLTSKDKPAAGDKVFTFGYPVVELLGNEIKYSEGAISSMSGIKNDQSLIQTTVPIQPGNSGSPLLNEQGEVIGMLTSTAALAAFLNMTGTIPQNINWAVKAEYISVLLDKQHSVGEKEYKSHKEKMADVQNCTCRIKVQK
jgi:S1-C subfamily serine protease